MASHPYPKTFAAALLLAAGAAILAFANPYGFGVQHAGASGETATATCTVVVGQPTANLDNNGPIPINQSATLTWSSTNAGSCTGSGFNTEGARSGSVSTGQLTGDTTYSVNCDGAVAPTTVIVYDPSVDISATPDRVSSGRDTQVTWTSALVSDCTITRNGAAFAAGPSGTNVPATNITTQTVFKADCDDGAATDTAIVNVAPRFEEF